MTKNAIGHTGNPAMKKSKKCEWCKKRKATWMAKHIHLTFRTPSCGWCAGALGVMWAVEKIKR